MTAHARALRASLGGALAALPIALALAGLMLAWRGIDAALWSHLSQHLLPSALANSVALALGVGLASAMLGGGLALLVALFEFPGRRAFSWALVLPLAMPGYVLAFTWVGLVDIGGTLPLLARRELGLSLPTPPLRTLWGAIALLSLASFPYVYVLVRAALAPAPRLIESARCLGASLPAALVRAVLPAMRPALAAGTSLAAMEALADFGVAATLSVDTLATTIYRTWFGLGSLATAAQLALALLAAAIAVSVLERLARRRAQYATRGGEAARIRLRGPAGWAASATCGIVLALAFGVPLAQLIAWAEPGAGADAALGAVRATAIASGVAALAVVACGLIALLARRTALARGLRELAASGYAMPGTVLATGTMIALLALESTTGLRGLSAGIAAVTLGLVARFARIGISGGEAAFATLRPSVLEAARMLGASALERWRRVTLPLLRPGLLATATLAFVECAKELPATLMLRPMGFDTLAVRIYLATSEGLWRQAALPALLLLLVGLVGVRLLERGDARSARAR